MSQIMKTYLGLFLLLLFSFTAAGFLGGFLQVIAAQDMHARLIDELENSNYYEGTIADAFEEAAAAGYSLKLTVYKDANTYVLEEGDSIPSFGTYVDGGKLELTFPFTIPFLGLVEEHVLTSYIR